MFNLIELFANHNFNTSPILKYFILTGMSQSQIQQEMFLSNNTSVDWYNFYRELCDEIMMQSSSMIGGPGKRVQIDESKFGKRKYHGHGDIVLKNSRFLEVIYYNM